MSVNDVLIQTVNDVLISYISDPPSRLSLLAHDVQG